MQTKTLTVPATLDSLAEIAAFVLAAADDAGLGRQARYRLRLAVDELATNTIIYGYPGRARGRFRPADDRHPHRERRRHPHGDPRGRRGAVRPAPGPRRRRTWTFRPRSVRSAAWVSTWLSGASTASRSSGSAAVTATYS